MQYHVLKLRRAESGLNCALGALEGVVMGRRRERDEDNPLDACGLGRGDNGQLTSLVDARNAVGARVVWEGGCSRHHGARTREDVGEARRLLDVALVAAHAVHL